jgi:hypothetical protein
LVATGLLGAGFAPVAGTEGAGFAFAVEFTPKAALLAAVFCCWTAFNLSCVFWMMFGDCAQALPPIINTRMLVVSFIGLPYLVPAAVGLAATGGVMS